MHAVACQYRPAATGVPVPVRMRVAVIIVVHSGMVV